MDLYELEPGDRVQLADGSIAEVVAESEDGREILVRYVESKDHALLGTERLCTEDEVEERVEIY
jgi:hypothetical protein